MRLVFAGTPEVAVPALQALLASDRHAVVAVVTRPDAPAGRGRRPARSPVGVLADRAGVQVLTPRRLGEPDFLARLAELAPDCCAVVAYGALVPPVALDVPKHGWVNLHFSLLPAWRGAAPVPAAIRHGDTITGASTFALEEGLDTGPVYGTLTEVIQPEDTAGELLSRLADAGAGLLVATLDGIADGSLSPVPQPPEGVSYAPKLTAQDAHVDFTAPAFAVHRQVRAVTPVPGAWVLFRDQRLGLRPMRFADSDPAVPGLPAPGELAPGELRVGKRAVLVGTATGALRLGEVTPAGKRAMPAADWARGARPEPGERFE
ncbi:MAG TPA: methionyl-tRNA formyltransferase [Pseudonocardiaceae bacterium]|nr:methionyl-tRNA formyltransferase [Pseudonocardiaceae bacterium]